MKLKPQGAILTALLIFIAGIIVASATGLWATESDKTPDRLPDPENAGSYDPADIRGSYTFSEISELYLIPLEDLAAAFGVPEADAAAFQCKNLETLYPDTQLEIGTASVKMFTAYYLGLPYEPTEETYLPESAVRVLTEKGRMTEEQSAYLEAHTIPAS